VKNLRDENGNKTSLDLEKGCLKKNKPMISPLELLIFKFFDKKISSGSNKTILKNIIIFI
jgi:hypothetical protein